MSKRAKRLWIMVSAQLACVGVGLWVQNQYVRSSIQRAAQREARSDLAAIANDLLHYLGASSAAKPEPGDSDSGRLQETLAARLPRGRGVIIVDHDWQVVARAGGPGLEDLPCPAPGERLSWEVAPEPPGVPSAVLQGTLDLPDGRYLASACPLPDSAGYVVACRPASDLAAASAALVRSLPALGIMTLIWTCALLGIAVHLILARFHEEVDRGRRQMAAQTLRRTQNLVRTRDAVIFGLAKLAESRDPETGDHLERISVYSTTLATALHRHPKYREEATPAFIRLIEISSALHDIGKVGIEDSILRKPGGLTKDERVQMATHTTIGGECLREIEQRLGSSNFLQMAREIALHHHERWDGAGYPLGAAGDAIPLAARVVSIVDVYDALSSKRVYKPALAHDECVTIIRNQAGRHFDPDLVDVWLRIEGKFREIAYQYGCGLPDASQADPNKHDDDTAGERQERLLLASTATSWDEFDDPRQP